MNTGQIPACRSLFVTFGASLRTRATDGLMCLKRCPPNRMPTSLHLDALAYLAKVQASATPEFVSTSPKSLV